nr:carbohydrate sulfotransferase 11-like isoform X1 [Lepeophtheirus salmonis]
MYRKYPQSLFLVVFTVFLYLHLRYLIYSEHSYIQTRLYHVKAIKKEIQEGFGTKDMTKKMFERRNLIREVCSRIGEVNIDKPWNFNGEDTQDFNVEQHIHPSNFLMDPLTKTLYCYVHKIGSSSLMNVYSYLDNNTDFLSDIKSGKKYLYEIDRRMNPSYSELMENLPDYYSFIVVRHPFERLLSAYRDRIVMNPCSDAAVYTTKAIFGSKALNASGCVAKVPSFRVFAQYIIDRSDHEELDKHWRPIYKLCSPCLINYDGIFRLNELNELFHLTGISRKYFKKMPDLKNPTKGGTSSKHVNKFYSNLKCNMIKDLGRVYKLDMLLFGYNSKIYEQMCIS